MYITHLVPITSYLKMEQNYSYTLPYPTPPSYMLIFGWASLGSLSDVISSHKSDNLPEMVVRDNLNQTSCSGTRARPATPRMRVTGLAGSFH